MGTSQADLVKYSIFALGLGSYLIYSAIKRHRQAREIEDTPCSKAASAAQGLNEFQGFAWTPGVGPKKMGGHDLVYYFFELQRQEDSHGFGKKRRKSWKPVYTYIYNEPFYLVDATGLVEVHLENAELIVSNQKICLWKSLGPSEKQHYMDEFIQGNVDNFPPSEGLLGIFSNNYRIVEREVLEGSPVYVKGEFMSHQSTPEKIQLPGLEKFYQQICDPTRKAMKDLSTLADTNRNGHVSLTERQSLYHKLARFARSQTKATSVDAEYCVYGKITHSLNHKILFSNSHQSELLTKLKNWNILRLATGSALIVTGVGVWLT